MVRMYWMGAFALLSVGCAAQKPPAPVARTYCPSTVGALAFDPPSTIGVDQPDLDRESRTPGAFYGYESLTSQSIWLWADDNQYNGGNGRYDRHAITVKSGVAYR